MNYRHAFHAGNFADVVKHIALIAALSALARKDKGFCVFDSHAGAGVYDLSGGEAARTGEALGGIARLRGCEAAGALPPALATYLECTKLEGGTRYPGSSRIAARLLRPQDRLVAIEKNPQEAAALRHALAEFRNARAVEADGHERLPALLPPPERRGLVLIDPPYEAPDEFERTVGLVARAHRRFTTGVYLVWYPIKSRAGADAFCGEVKTRLAGAVLRVEIDIGRACEVEKGRLSAAGLLVANPPYGFDEEMKHAADLIAPRLGRDPEQPASITIG